MVYLAASAEKHCYKIFGGIKLKSYEMPIGFSMALALNPDAMERFAMMNEEQKQQIIDGTHSIKSKQEMHEYVNKLAKK